LIKPQTKPFQQQINVQENFPNPVSGLLINCNSSFIWS